MPTEQFTDPTRRQICWQCVKEAYLSSQIRNNGVLRTCSYCQQSLPTFTIPELADKIDHAFADFYELTPSEPWERDGYPIQDTIADAAEIAELPARDIREILADRHFDVESDRFGEECPYAESSHYDLKAIDRGDFDAEWKKFEVELKTQTRFFSGAAKSILDRIFDDVENLRTSAGIPVVVTVGPGSRNSILHRARVFSGPGAELQEALCAPWRLLGSPPSSRASAGRMNAHGIAVFYAALDAETALAEVRPPVGSKVAIAEFKIIRPLRLLDLAALRGIDTKGSIFDPETLPKQQRSGFLATLSERLSAPVMPGDEASEYLTTQVVADYLANVADLDGIIFPSVQTGGSSSNVVLFRHAARVIEEPTTEIGTFATLQMHDSDGIHPEYLVVKAQKPAESADNQDVTMKPEFPSLYDEAVVPPNEPDPALKIDLAKISIYHVEAVRYEHRSHAVERINMMKVRDYNCDATEQSLPNGGVT